MSNALAVVTSNPNLLRCELHRLKNQVLLTEQQGGSLPAIGLGSYEQEEVLLQEYSVASLHTSFAELWRGVASDVVLYHASDVPSGAQLERYAQPFRFRQWLFSHQGIVQEYPRFRMKLLAALPELLQRQVPGDTPSEGAFALFLKNARELGRLDDPSFTAEQAAEALRRTAKQVHSYAVESGAVMTPELNLFATNGHTLVVARMGPRPLFYTLLEGSSQCEVCGIDAQTPDTQPLVIAHRRRRAVAVASQLAKNAPAWIELAADSVLSVDRNLRVQVSPL
jgi:predicted glutamine amidotransferase